MPYRRQASEVATFSRALLPPLVSRIKIMGRMNIAERRLPQACHHTGYHGRIAAIELLEMNEALAASVTDGLSTAHIKATAIDFGMTTLTQNALMLARNGTTSLEEVFAVRLE